MDQNFDRFAENYDVELAKGLSATGEDKQYFAKARIKWLIKFLRPEGVRNCRAIMDFGCGDGGSIPYLAEEFDPTRLTGVDLSSESIRIAARSYEMLGGVEFKDLRSFVPDGEFDLVFTNGVFHHIPPNERTEAFFYCYRSLRRGGYLILWENNPWNLGTRYVMSRIPFDRDAIMLYPSETTRSMRQAGFQIEKKDFQFIFPSFLKRLRGLEPMLSSLPLGGQYVIAGRKL